VPEAVDQVAGAAAVDPPAVESGCSQSGAIGGEELFRRAGSGIVRELLGKSCHISRYCVVAGQWAVAVPGEALADRQTRQRLDHGGARDLEGATVSRWRTWHLPGLRSVLV
jgi:hypothetical protein